MTMKKSWFSLVKRLFIWDSHSTTQDKKEKRRKWVFGRIKTKRLPTIAAPPATLSNSEEKTTKLSEAEEEQSKHALTVAIASAAAAEAAVAAAQVAAEVVLLTGVPQFSHKLNKEKSEEESQTAKTRNGDSQYTYQCQRSIKESAAIKIQTFFRGYLARKALRALKGIVKLQAIIRGRAVRRQAMSTLKCLQSIVSIQSQVCARRRLTMAEGGKWENEELQQDSKDKIIRMDLNSERKWDDSTLLKEEVYASCISKKEAALKRERIKEYSFNHRRSAETERSKVNGRWRYWMEQWVDTQLSKSKELEDLDSVFSSNSRIGDEHGLRHLKLRNMQNNRQSPLEGLDSPVLVSRKSFPHHRRQCSVGEEQNNNNNNNNSNNSFSSSPVTPAYMAATESARAKARSTSSPKVRTGNSECDSYSPCKKKISVVSSINNEVLRSGKFCGGTQHQQRSPSLKGISLPIKSRGAVIKDLSINSDCSLPHWDRQISFK